MFKKDGNFRYKTKQSLKQFVFLAKKIKTGKLDTKKANPCLNQLIRIFFRTGENLYRKKNKATSRRGHVVSLEEKKKARKRAQYENGVA